MKIGFDVSQVGAGKAGCGFYAHALAKCVPQLFPDHEFIMLPSFGDFYFDPLMVRASPYRGKNVSYGARFINKQSASKFWNGDDVERQLGLDLVHCNNFWCPSVFISTPVIYTLYDLSFMVDPNWTTETNRLGCVEGVFRAAAHADWIVSISENSAHEFKEIFPNFPEDRIRVIYPCSRFSGLEGSGYPPRSISGIVPGQFWLSVGTIEPRKNQKMLLRAYADYLKADRAPLPLVLAGGNGWLMDNLDQFINSLGLDGWVKLTGYVTDDELIWLYRNCFANLYPSLYEGFGLPVLEGMQFGAAIIASNASSIPEITGDAGILLNPNQSSDWTNIMLKFSSCEIDVQRQRQYAIDRAARFDWAASAASLMSLYDTARLQPKRRQYIR